MDELNELENQTINLNKDLISKTLESNNCINKNESNNAIKNNSEEKCESNI